MAVTSKPIWSEGMLVRPQHLQQYDRWVEQLLENRVAGLVGNGWGVRRLAFDRNLLVLGQIALTELEVVMPDGTALALPEHGPLPAPRAVPPAAKNALVKIAIAARRADAGDLATAEAPLRRFGQEVLRVRNTAALDKPAVDISVATPASRLVFQGEAEDDLVTVGLARIQDAQLGGAVTLSDTYVPPCLDVRASPRVLAVINEIRSLLRSRGDALAARADPSRAGADSGGLIDLVTLSIVNGAEALFDHYAAAGDLHPEPLFERLIELAGRLSSFTGDRRKPADLPVYRHDDLEGSFTPLVDMLRRLLAVVMQHGAVSLPLQDRGYGILIAMIADRTLFQDSRFVLAAVASVPTESLRSQLPLQMKIGSVEQIRDLVNLQLPGVPIRALAVAPREMPFMQNAVYFELDQSAELWRSLPRSAAFAFHVSGEYSDLHLEFWAIRGKRT